MPETEEVRAFQDRAARARALAERFPESSEALSFYADLAELQAALDPKNHSILEARVRLVKLAESGPPELRAAAHELDDSSCREGMKRYLDGSEHASPRSFFARALLQIGYGLEETSRSGGMLGRCPHCSQPPQVGVLRREGDGTAASLVCAICMREWRLARGACAGCGETEERKLVHYHAPELAHLKLSACESCHRYVHFVDLEVEPSAIPEVDELAAMALDVWARENGYRKLVPNLLGI